MGGGDAPLGVPVVEEEDEGLEGAPVAGHAEQVGGDLAGPERLRGRREQPVEFLGVGGAGEFSECGGNGSFLVLDLVPQSIDHRAEFGIFGDSLGDFHESEAIRDPHHIFPTSQDWRARYRPVNLK
ncbi:hypothetical protein Shyd_81450 [Streptomyces hydrogenans]|uniref:Uncharacterized protein n=1 Tax=Streptomyces hydrogenans TaxID=1873719 RepID=A0ABQ3PP21_9ACTN|nr:hypothetical protein GCM10018784_16090 [Streptomyces hydrogenans]GHI26774.1 hypothetical protein Shyd_81450 [Streptomyces hydrogenans]